MPETPGLRMALSGDAAAPAVQRLMAAPPLAVFHEYEAVALRKPLPPETAAQKRRMLSPNTRRCIPRTEHGASRVRRTGGSRYRLAPSSAHPRQSKRAGSAAAELATCVVLRHGCAATCVHGRLPQRHPRPHRHAKHPELGVPRPPLCPESLRKASMPMRVERATPRESPVRLNTGL